MLRKLIMLAATGVLAKKAWDSYQQKNGTASAGGGSFGGRGTSSGGTGVTRSDRSGGVSSASSSDKPSAL